MMSSSLKFLILLLNLFKLTFSDDNFETLQLVNVLFRHGNRTPQTSEVYPNDPYLNETYEPYGWGHLTQKGIEGEYLLGKALRARYDKFLGKSSDGILVAQSSAFNRTEQSLEMVLKGLFFNETGIPYIVTPRNSDKIMRGVDCTRFKALYEEHANSVQEEFWNKYSNLFNYISKHTGSNITKVREVAKLYFGLTSERDWGFDLPAWTSKVFPDPMSKLAAEDYLVFYGTERLRTLGAGFFLRKIIKDAKEKMNGNLYNKKMFLYSGHENNIASCLISLGIFEPVEVPVYGSYLILELHKLNNKYGFKVYYQNYHTENPKLLKLKKCGEFCEFEQFEANLHKYIINEEICNV